MALRTAKMVRYTYQRHRRVKAHGAVAKPGAGNHGLLAGCAFAKDILKASLALVKKACEGERPKREVDDTTLYVYADTADECADRMGAQMERLKEALIRGNMVLNDGNQQVLGVTVEVRCVWERLGTMATGVAKDRGVSHFGYGTKHPGLAAKLAAMCQTAKHINVTVGNTTHAVKSPDPCVPENGCAGRVSFHRGTPIRPDAPEDVRGSGRWKRATIRRHETANDGTRKVRTGSRRHGVL